MTSQEIQGAQRDGAENPIARALQRIMGTPWFLTDEKYAGGTLVYELVPPYHVAVLDPETYNNWKQYRSSGLMWPFEFAITFEDQLKHRDT